MFDLALVMPVYNEEGCITETLHDWIQALEGLAIRYRIIALNDGSTDDTGTLLDSFSSFPQVEIVHHVNCGHGPTILTGYRRAVALAEWVFQCDSDGEMPASHFNALWAQREDFDALFGYREGRRQGPGRKLISACSRLAVKLLFGKGVRDVNVPYRLMRSTCLERIIPQIPDTTFAPNVIISGAFSKAKLRLANVSVPFQPRRTGTVSIAKWKLWKAAFRSFWQVCRCRPVLTEG